MSKYSIFFSSMTLLIVFFVSYWLNNEVKKELEVSQKKITNNPDYFLKNFTSRQTNEKGEVNFSLAAELMNFYSYNEESTLKKPMFIKYENEKKVFDMVANNGIIFDKGEKIKMLGGVEMLKHETKDKKIMKLLSEEIIILPNKDILLSDKKIKIIQEPNIEVDGVGLNYNKKLGIIKIMKDVKVQYVK